MQVTEKLTTYYHHYQELKEKGGPEENTELFEEVIHLEEEIMAAYGLPPSHTHLQILWQFTEKAPLSEEVIQGTQEKLETAATEHLMAPVKTNLEVLQEAKSEKMSAFNVLPEIGQPTHDYPIFLFEEMLLKDKASPEAVLQEMESVKELDCYGEVATLLYYHRKTFRRTKIYKALKPHLQFLDTYLQQLKALGESAEHSIFVSSLAKEAQQLSQPTTLPEDKIISLIGVDPATYRPESILLTDIFEMEEIVYDVDTAITVTGKLNKGDSSKDVSLGFDLGELCSLLSQYQEQGQQILAFFHKTPDLNLPDSPIVINLKDCTGSTFLAEQHYFRVYKPLVLGEDGTHQMIQEEFYLVEEILEKDTFDAEQLKSTSESLNGLLQHLKGSYQEYVAYLQEGETEKKARQKTGLDHPTTFELARQLYNYEKHGGKASFD
ncbi:hypothetical protein [Rufibacter hautae]|uniref:Uncharacterized protein n=1 Tax=Rufibacter hautae TaxID=2595005 RepID=A0A5B6TBY1_9BACT|nr:hypothetical protein [Rufibacter hautae]KAA3437678.1 hypothetical protein FOA19_10260 [Rufibacter hautae]